MDRVESSKVRAIIRTVIVHSVNDSVRNCDLRQTDLVNRRFIGSEGFSTVFHVLRARIPIMGLYFAGSNH